MKKTILPICAILATILISGCASKKPYKVDARPIAVSQVAPIAKDIQRRTPGQVMDPEAEVFAQVPKRIIYLPGEHGLTGRRSAEQIAAYSLVKVGSLPEIQTNQPTSVILTDPNQNPAKGSRDIINMTIDGTQEGTARVLHVRESEQIDLARGRIRGGETLKFFDQTGWVGWIPKQGTGPTAPPPSLLPRNANPLPPLPPEPNLPEPQTEEEKEEAAKETPTPTPTPEDTVPVPPRLSPAPRG